MIWDKIEKKINETFKSDNKKQDEATDEKENNFHFHYLPLAHLFLFYFSF